MNPAPTPPHPGATLILDRAAIERYGRQWGTDPFQLWSRRWEYPFAAERILAFADRFAPGMAPGSKSSGHAELYGDDGMPR